MKLHADRLDVFHVIYEITHRVEYVYKNRAGLIIY